MGGSWCGGGGGGRSSSGSRRCCDWLEAVRMAEQPSTPHRGKADQQAEGERGCTSQAADGPAKKGDRRSMAWS